MELSSSTSINHSLEQKLPEDIILNVSLRLSSKELCRLKCMSKLWYHYISECRSRRWKSSPAMIGFFYQNIRTSSRGHNDAGFLFTSRKKSDGVSMDECVGILDGKNVYIVASYKEFLLCFQQMQDPDEFDDLVMEDSPEEDPMEYYDLDEFDDPVMEDSPEEDPMEYGLDEFDDVVMEDSPEEDPMEYYDLDEFDDLVMEDSPKEDPMEYYDLVMEDSPEEDPMEYYGLDEFDDLVMEDSPEEDPMEYYDLDEFDDLVMEDSPKVDPMEYYGLDEFDDLVMEDSSDEDPMEYYGQMQDNRKSGYQMDYYVHNPATKQWVALPKTQRVGKIG